MITTLKQRLIEYRELDAKRTQGIWRSGLSWNDGRTDIAMVGTDCDHQYVTGIRGKDGYNMEVRAQDAPFIASAPAMVNDLQGLENLVHILLDKLNMIAIEIDGLWPLENKLKYNKIDKMIEDALIAAMQRGFGNE